MGSALVPVRSSLAILHSKRTATRNPTKGSALNFSRATPAGAVLQFSSPSYLAGEAGGSAIITVTRSADTTGAVTVDYATSDGTASERSDYTTALGRLRFAAGETSKSFPVLITDDLSVEGNETVNLTLSNPTGDATLGSQSTAVLTLNDNDLAPSSVNPIDQSPFFVRQQYLDFLNREPDAAGFAFWQNEIEVCGADVACREVKRINVSAAFYLSIEFQNTGFLVERLYKASYGSANGASTFGGTHQLPVPIVRFKEFLLDTQEIGRGVVVLQPGWETVLENNKQAFTADFVQRSRFTTAFPSSMTPAQFVDTLNVNAGNPLSQSERDQLVNDLSTNARTRAQVLRAVAEDSDLISAESNRAFVLMQYFGYLRRNPNDPQDTDYTGYDFWLTKLNQFNGNFIQAEMVKAFLSSIEYRARFVQSAPSNQPPSVNAGADQEFALPNTTNLSGTVMDDGLPSGSSLLVSWNKVSGPGSVIFGSAGSASTSAIFNAPGAYVLRLTASDGQLTRSDDVNITINPDPVAPPPDPSTVAPLLDATIATTVFLGTGFLYDGPNPIQTGVAPGTINPMRVAILRGKVKDGNNAPLPKVKVTILNHPEFGQTLTRADGAFDMAVNGGGLLTLKFEKVGLMPAQRQLMTPWQDYVIDDDVVMLPYDDRVTTVDLSANTPIQVVTGNSVTDSSGSRRNVLMFKQGTSALMTLPGGSTQSLSLLHVRSTEYTAGPLGLAAMPGDLPATSAFTYASEYSLDEAVAAGAIAVSFSQTVAQYNENFLNFPVGTVIPSGSYDKTNGIWMPSTNGLVVKILSVSSGAANLDIDGSGNAASDASLTALGINAAERQQLAALFSVGQALWRVPLNHFSSWDSNFGFGPPSGGGTPNGGSASGGGGGPGGSGPGGSDPCIGCILGMQDQRLSEEVSLVGSNFFLRYDSTRPRGNIGNFTARIPLSGATLPGPVKRIEVTLSIAGQTQQLTFPAQPNQSTSFTWDGRDAYGRTVQGQQELNIDIGNVYDGVYVQTPAFGYNGNGVPITVNTRREITIHRRQKVRLGTYAAPPQSLGGWSLSVNHVYDPVGQTLYEGNGKRRSVQTVSNGIDTFAGGLSGFLGDGGPVSGARFRWPYGLAVGPDNSVYVADSGNQRVRKIAPDGIVTTFSGNGGGCNPSNFPCGDGGPAANASFGGVNRVAIGNNGTVYIGGGRNLWSVTPDGIFHRLAGLAVDGFSGDGGPAVDAQISNATRFYPAADGSVYLSDMLNQRIRRIDPNGIINTIAGTGTAGFGGDGGPATQAQINYPGDIVAAPDGSVYFIDQDNNRIRRISSDGIISTYAGTGTFGSSPDGLPALQTNFIFRAANPIEAGSMSLGPDGSLYVVSYVFPNGGRVRRIGPDGIVTGVAGNGQIGSQGDGGPALQSQMRLAAIGLGPDGSVYAVGGFTFDFDESRIRKISPPLPAFNATNIAIPSEDGTQLFRFDANGRHLSTINTLTGATVYTFAYESAGRLTTVTDGDSNVTTIERDGSGNPTGIRSPYNQLTAFTRNGDGYLATITNPANEQYQFTYNAGGQMLTERDPRNNQNTFTYDSMGRLTRDDDPAGGFQTLARADAGVDFTVTRNTALNRQSAFQVNNLSNGDRERINTLSEGTQTRRLERGSGIRTFTDPDGTITNETLGGDPRWKLQAPITTNTTIATPGGLNFTATFARTATLSTPGDLLSLATQTDALNVNGRAYTNVFTAANRTFVLTTPQNRQGTRVIDTQGRTTQLQFANLNADNFAYDSRGRLSVAAGGSGAETRTFNLAYNAGGFLSSVTNPLNQATSFLYDLTGRVTQRTLPDSRIIAFGYDPKGNLTTLTPQGKPAHTFTYTPIDLVASYTAPNVGGNSTTTFAYNLDRQITNITRPDALQVNYTYDSAGRLQTLTVPNGNYGLAYSATTGLLSSITAPGGGVVAYQYDGFLLNRQTWTGTVAGNVSQTFDNNFRVASQSINNANTINFIYDNDNLLTGAGSLTLTHNVTNGFLTGSSLGSVNDTFTYDGFAEPTNYNAKFNATTLYDVNYAYDKLGRITQKTENIGGVTTTYAYGYDATGRLTSVTLNGGPLAIYSYDSNDNRTVANFGGPPINGTYDAQDRLTQYGNNTYTYTANGELLSKTIAASTTQYGYDVMGNLRNVTLPNTTQIEYLIDGQNRRIGKKVNGTLMQSFLYQDQLEPVAELDGSNNIVSRFVYGSRANVPDYLIKAGVTYRIITDPVGSVRLVVDVATGAIAQRIDYDEFGVILNDTNPGFQPFGFAGGLYDTQTNLTRFGARDYDAETGRWTAKDPIGFGGGSTNLYAYVSNNPVNFTDTSGNQLSGLGGLAGSGNPVTWGDVSQAVASGAVGAAAGVLTTPFVGPVAGTFNAGVVTSLTQSIITGTINSINSSAVQAGAAAGKALADKYYSDKQKEKEKNNKDGKCPSPSNNQGGNSSPGADLGNPSNHGPGGPFNSTGGAPSNSTQWWY